LRVIVAEDERYVRATIISILPYQSMEITIVAEASDGREALECCREYTPDVLITDIRMPEISGLDLIERVVKICPNIHIVIISGFDCFDYAKRAMSLGVKHYLLKPVEEEDLSNALSSIYLEIKNRLKETGDATELQRKLKQLLPLSIEKSLNTLVRNDLLIDGRFYSNLSEAGIKFLHTYYSVIISEFTSEGVSTESDGFHNKHIYKSSDFDCYRAMDYQRENTYFYIVNHSFSKDEYISKMIDLVKQLKEQHGYLNIIGISDVGTKINMLGMLYEQALSACELYFWKQQKDVFVYSTNCFSELKDFSHKREEMSRKLADYLRLNNTNEGILSFLQLIEELSASEPMINPSVLKDFVFLILCDVLKELNMEYLDIIKEYDINQNIYNSRSIVQIKNIIKKSINTFADRYQSRLVSESPVIGVKRLIEQNPESDYSLEQLAKYAGYHITHFSELFKNEVGMSFIEFKKTTKMNYAKELLEKTSFKIDQIAERLGYNDSKYFIKLFKAYFNESPNQYRKKYTFFPKK